MNKDTAKKTRLGLIACATTFVFLGSTGAFAGEIAGNGKSVPGGEKGRSECSYSGREDTPGETFPDGTRVFKGLIAQSWGQLTAEAKAFFLSIGAHPGNACNPKKSGG